MARRLILVAMMVMGFGVLAAPVALADTQDIIEPQFGPPNEDKSGFQSGTCIEDVPPAIFCTAKTSDRFYKLAAGHPPIGFTQYKITRASFSTRKKPPIGSTNSRRATSRSASPNTSSSTAK